LRHDAAAADPSLYQWSPVPQGERQTAQYIDTALAWRNAGSALPFAIVRVDDGIVVGSTPPSAERSRGFSGLTG